MRNPLVALLLLSSAQSAITYEGILDPSTYSSPSGEYALFVNPSRPTGGGPGTYRFTRNGVEVWSGSRPWTLRGVEVTDDGLVGGFAYGAGPRGGEGDSLTIVLLDAEGKPRLEEHRERKGVASCMTMPDSLVNGLFLDPAHDRLVVRFLIDAQQEDWGMGESWRTYSLSTGAPGPRVLPRTKLPPDERLGSIQAARALPGTGLVLLHWAWYDTDHVGSVFTLVDADCELRWRLDWPFECSGDDPFSASSVLWQEMRRQGGILDVEAPGRFTIGHAATLERSTFVVRSIAGVPGAVDVRELAREPLELEPAKRSPWSASDEPVSPPYLGSVSLDPAPSVTPSIVDRLGIESPRPNGPARKWYAQPGTGRTWIVEPCEISLFDADGHELRSIERAPDGKWLRLLKEAAVAPDGSIAIISVAYRLGPRIEMRLLVFSPDGEPRRCLDLPPEFDAYCPLAFDGRRLASRVWATDGMTASLALLDLDTRRIQSLRVRRTEHPGRPAFAADGTELWIIDREHRAERYRLE